MNFNQATLLGGVCVIASLITGGWSAPLVYLFGKDYSVEIKNTYHSTNQSRKKFEQNVYVKSTKYLVYVEAYPIYAELKGEAKKGGFIEVRALADSPEYYWIKGDIFSGVRGAFISLIIGVVIFFASLFINFDREPNKRL
jgi:hypothetical protein